MNPKSSIKVGNKIAANTTQFALHFASCLFTYNCNSQLRKHKQKLHITYSTSWHTSMFGYKLRTIEAGEQLRLEILKKLRTASLNSEFTGSCKKV